MVAGHATITHFVERREDGWVWPVCDDWNGATNWTIDERVATCVLCLQELAARRGEDDGSDGDGGTPPSARATSRR